MRTPTWESFTVQDVPYNEITRGKVLDVCRRGGAEQDPASLESVRVAGCAPLIFYFWQYGDQKQAPDAVEAARKLYWYARRRASRAVLRRGFAERPCCEHRGVG